MTIKLITIILTLLSSFQAFANQSDHVLKCEGQPFESVWLYLDEGSLSEKSKNFRVLGATIVFNYSSTISMSCNSNYYKRDGSDALKCAGYYYSDDLTQIKFFPENGKIYVEWQTSKSYGSQNFKTECKLVKNN